MTRIKYATFVALLATVAATNLALETWGVIPIGFGLEAPAGVFFAGLAATEFILVNRAREEM